MGRFLPLVAFAVATFGLGAPVIAADTAHGLQPHRAIYSLNLGAHSDKTSIGQVTGKLVYEFAGSACEGFTTQFRFVTQIESNDGKSRLTDLRTSSFEDAGGKSFDFYNQNFIDQTVTEESKGKAKLTGAGIDVALTKPADKKFAVNGDIAFPNQHLIRVIDGAKAGDKIGQIKMYDGSEAGDRVFQTTVVYGNEIVGADPVGEETAAKIPAMATVRRWPVTISYFDPKKARGEETPDYQLSFVLYENGVSRHLSLDYGDFKLEGRLIDLQMNEAPACN